MATYSGRFARQEIKRRRKAFKRAWAFVGAIALGTSALTAVFLALVLPGRSVPVWLLGPVAVGFAFWAARAQFDGTYHLQSAIDAEGWTSRDLRKSLVPGWQVVDWISFGEQGDVDHVVVGPSGVFVIETKYTDSSQASKTGRSIVQGWVDQSHEAARRVGLLLKYNYGHKIDVAPLVVASGPPELKLPSEAEGITVIRRRDLGQHTAVWRSMPAVLSRDQVESIRAALLDFRGIREDFDRTHARSMEPS